MSKIQKGIKRGEVSPPLQSLTAFPLPPLLGAAAPKTPRQMRNGDKRREGTSLYRPYFPDKWEEKILFDLAEWKNGLAFSDISFSDDGMPVIKIAELKNGITNQTKFTYQAFDDSVFLTKSDMVFSWSGNPETSIDVFWYDLPDGWLNQHIFKITTKEEIDEIFFFYILKYLKPNFTKIASNKQTTGLGHVTISDLKQIKVRIPPLSTQCAIAATLSCLDDKIELNRRINVNLEAQAQAIFKSWFVDFEPWGGVMPENWREGTASDLGDIIGGSTPSKAKPEFYAEQGIAWITPKDLSVNKSKFIAHGANDITELGLCNSSARLMPRGTVLFSSRAPIGYIAIASGEVCTNQGFKSIVPKENVGTAFVYFFLRENLQTIEGMASGSTFKEVSGSTMKGILAVIPDDDTLRRFQEECTPIFEKQELLEAENTCLAAIRDTLLPKLMSGEIEENRILI